MQLTKTKKITFDFNINSNSNTHNLNSSRIKHKVFEEDVKETKISYFYYQLVPLLSIFCSKRMENKMKAIKIFDTDAKSLISFNSLLKLSYKRLRDYWLIINTLIILKP